MFKLKNVELDKTLGILIQVLYPRHNITKGYDCYKICPRDLTESARRFLQSARKLISFLYQPL